MFKIKAADGTNNLCGRRIAEIRKSKKLSQRKLVTKLRLIAANYRKYSLLDKQKGRLEISSLPFFYYIYSASEKSMSSILTLTRVTAVPVIV